VLDPQRYEVLRWDRMFPVLSEWIQLQRNFERFFMVMVLFLAAGAVSNVAMVASLGRRREFAMMLALGHRRRDLGRLMLLESTLLGLLGCGAGLMIGLPLVALLGHSGLDLSSWLGDTRRFYLEPMLHPSLSLGSILFLTSAVLLFSILAAVYPAWRTDRVDTVQILSARG